MENLTAPETLPPPESPDSISFTVHLQRGEMGFGFRIIGGQEEGTQVMKRTNSYSFENVFGTFSRFVCSSVNFNIFVVNGIVFFVIIRWQ